MGRRKELRDEANLPSFRKACREVQGIRCVNCGCEEGVEYHHIVPLYLGGTNSLPNIVPLCHSCHMAIHHGGTISDYNRRQHRGGRKALVTDAAAFKAFDLMLDGQIGTKMCKRLLGLSNGSAIHDMRQFKDWLRARGISDMRTDMDARMTNAHQDPQHGDAIGWYIPIDGERMPIRFNDTGINTIIYKKRYYRDYYIPGIGRIREEDIPNYLRTGYAL